MLVDVDAVSPARSAMANRSSVCVIPSRPAAQVPVKNRLNLVESLTHQGKSLWSNGYARRSVLSVGVHDVGFTPYTTEPRP